MKIRLTNFFLILAVLWVFTPIEVRAYTYGDYLSYRVNNDNTITIMDCDESATSITIPSKIDGKIVTSICEYAFHECTSLTNISIPNSVIDIGKNAFSFCSSIESIIIPDSVTSIGDGAFSYCTSLKYVSLSNSISNISESLFYHCGSLTEINIPDSIIDIDNDAFANCTSLTSISIPNSVTSIGNYAFTNCTSLTNISIPSSVVNIGTWAFNGCNSLVSIDVNSDNRIYSSQNGVLFNKSQTMIICYPAGKTNANYSIPSGVTNIATGAFYNNNSLTNVNIPKGVTSISSEAFEDCKSLISVIIPDGVTNIGNGSFLGCSALTRISIPKSVISIGYLAFESSPLKDIYYGGMKSQWQAIAIDDYNDILNDVTIYYNAIGTNLPRISSTPTINNNKININLSDVEYDSILITVFSNGSKMVYSSVTPLSAGDTTKSVVLPNNGENQVKVFIWNSLEGMRPLCEAKTVAVK